MMILRAKMPYLESFLHRHKRLLPVVRRIKLMSDYECSPVWENGESPGNIDLEELPISVGLRERLHAWAKAYDQTLNRADPSASCFASKEAEDAFERDGLLLSQALVAELGSGYEVNYYSERVGRLLSKDEIEAATGK